MFGVATSVIADQEQYRTLASYPDGSPKVQEFRGPLVVRYTNTTTGESVVRDLSGYGWFHYGARGGVSVFVASHIDVTIPAGNAGFPPGEWVINGQSVVSPLVAVILGWWLLGEQISRLTLLAAGAISVGVALIMLHPQPAAER